MSIKAIIFDFDGVLVESVDVKTRAFAEMYQVYGIDVVNRVTAFHLRHGGVSRYEKFRYFEEKILGRGFSPEKEKNLGEIFSKKVVDAVVEAPWVKGAYEFVSRHHRELAMFVASGTPEEEMKDIIERRDMGQYFIAVYGSPPTKVEIIKRICETNGYESEDVLFVGDSMTDYEASKMTGVRFIGRTAGPVSPFPPGTTIVKDLTDLYERCRGLKF